MEISFKVSPGTGSSSNLVWVYAVDAADSDKPLIIMPFGYSQALALVPDKIPGFKVIDKGDVGWYKLGVFFEVEDEKLGSISVAELRSDRGTEDCKLMASGIYVFDKNKFSTPQEFSSAIEQYIAKWPVYLKTFIDALNWVLNKKGQSVNQSAFDESIKRFENKKFTI